MISKELQQTIEKWYVLKTYEYLYENLHRDIQADIDHYFDVTGNYGQVLSDNDWAALCKEWASEEEYLLLEFGKCVYLIPDDFEDEELCFGDYNCFSEKTIPETIFKATQWIYDYKGN